MDLIGSIKKLKHITELSTDILDRMLHLSFAVRHASGY